MILKKTLKVGFSNHENLTILILSISIESFSVEFSFSIQHQPFLFLGHHSSGDFYWDDRFRGYFGFIRRERKSEIAHHQPPDELVLQRLVSRVALGDQREIHALDQPLEIGNVAQHLDLVQLSRI